MKLKISNIIVLEVLRIFFSGSSQAQISQETVVVYSDSVTNYFQIAGYGSSAYNMPFWMKSNQFGIVPNSGNALSVRAGAEHYENLSRSEKKNRNLWRMGVGVEMVGNFAKENQLLVPQLHATLRFRNWELFAGRKKQWVGLADSTLGTGSYAWSGNALPLPKIQIGTRGFVDVPFTKGWFSFNAFYSDGIFENNRPVTSGLKLHQKALYMRIGNKSSRLKLLGGFNHQVQWGGYSPFETKDGKLPGGFKNYLNAVTGKAYPSGQDLTVFDYNNRIGNHLGSIDLALQYFGHEYSWFVYRQNLYEDGSLASLINIADGLNGVSIKKQNSYGANFEVTQIVLEFLFTKSQGGSIWEMGNVLGRDNYFNNSQIRDGWSYFDRTIGTPFIPPTSDTNWKWPNYSNFFTSNNRVAVFYAGLSGTLFQQFFWTGKFSYSSNAGTYDLPMSARPTQFSGFLSLQTKLRFLGGVTSSLNFAMDKGQLYHDTYGLSVSFIRYFQMN